MGRFRCASHKNLNIRCGVTFSGLTMNQRDNYLSTRNGAAPSQKLTHLIVAMMRPSQEELDGTRTERARTALFTWYRRCIELDYYRTDHGHCKCCPPRDCHVANEIILILTKPYLVVPHVQALFLEGTRQTGSLEFG